MRVRDFDVAFKGDGWAVFTRLLWSRTDKFRSLFRLEVLRFITLIFFIDRSLSSILS